LNFAKIPIIKFSFFSKKGVGTIGAEILSARFPIFTIGVAQNLKIVTLKVLQTYKHTFTVWVIKKPFTVFDEGLYTNYAI